MRGAHNVMSGALLALLHAVAADPPLDLTILSWNIHWQCGSDHLPGCRAAATAKVAALAKLHKPAVIVAVELEHNDTAPVNLPTHGGVPDRGWLQVNGSCPGAKPGATGDALALLVNTATGWEPVFHGSGAGRNSII